MLRKERIYKYYLIWNLLIETQIFEFNNYLKLNLITYY